MIEDRSTEVVSAKRLRRADAQRNSVSLLDAAAEVFAASGVDAPVREIAEDGVGDDDPTIVEPMAAVG